MNTINTKNVGALDSEGVSPVSDFTFTPSESPIGFSRVDFTAPQKPGNNWDTVFSGVCVDLMNQGAIANQLVLKGDKLVLSRRTQLAVNMTVDDHGDLLISNTELADDAISAAFALAPTLGKHEPDSEPVQNPIEADITDVIDFADYSNINGALCLHTDLIDDEWKDFDNAAAAWKRPVRTLILPEGTYFIYGRVTNDPMNGGNANNRKLFRYAIQAKQACEAVEYNGGTPQVCSTCGCGNTTDGDADRHAATQAPGWEGDPCPSFVTLNPTTGKALYDSPWRWTASIESDRIVITPPVGDTLVFALPAEDASDAGTIGHSAMAINRIQYQDADFNPTTSRTPDYIMMKDANGLCLTFAMESGKVYGITTPEGRKVTAMQRAEHVQTQFDGEGNLLSCASAEAKLICTMTDDNTLQLDWFTPNAEEGAAPFKQEFIQRNGSDTTLTRQQTGRDPHSLVRSENNGVVTITKGVGDEAIVHRYETTYPMNGLMVRTESVYFAVTPDNVASCTRSVYNYSDAGWQLYSVTEGFGSDVAGSTQYIYNGNRLAKVLRYDGSYTEYEYDSLGRSTMEKSPWADGLAKLTRTAYAEARFFDIRPATVAEYYVNASGAEVLFRHAAHSYEESAELERITTIVTAGGSSQQQVSIEESFGPEPAYAYAAGKPKFSQDIAGVQTVHEYTATSEHGAIHKHTTITKANGELVAAQSRKSESFIAADDTTTFEQESIWDGTQWLLLDTSAYEYDEQQRVVKTTRGNGRFSTTEWMCCGRLSETDEDGITTTYAYDSARQLKESTRSAVYDGEVCITPETITEFTHDAAGRDIHIITRKGAATVTSHMQFDLRGRICDITDTIGRTYSIRYDDNNLSITEVAHSGAESVTTSYPGGNVKCTTNSDNRTYHYYYDLLGHNLRTTTRLNDGSIAKQTIVNGFGQTIVEATPTTTGFIYTRSEYNTKGQMMKQYSDTGYGTDATAPTLYEYDIFGNVCKQTLEISPHYTTSHVQETSFGIEVVDDGVYSLTTQIQYSATGNPIRTIQKQLVSELSPILASKNINIDVRGNTSVSWTEYSAPAKLTKFNIIPTSKITAVSIEMDGLTLLKKDHAGIVTTFYRTYTATGMTLEQKDGRGNSSFKITDLAGRVLQSIDTSGHYTTSTYDSVHDQPTMLTDEQGNTIFYKYNLQGRKVAEWGAVSQPACFGYDDMGNMNILRTFRAGNDTINTDPSNRTDYDQTSWVFHPVTGLEISKTYPDNSSVVKTYDAFNRLATVTDARGNIKTHSYEHARGLLLCITYSTTENTATTSTRSFSYNHLGQLTQVVDDAGVRTLIYNDYGELYSDSIHTDGDTHTITENRDSCGRSVGYSYSKNNSMQQTVSSGYGEDGRIATVGFLHGGEEKQFAFEYLTGSHLLHKLIKPNGMTLTQTYEAQRDLLIDMAYHRGNTLVAQRSYSYDNLGRPTVRNTARQGIVVSDIFTYNTRSELVEAQVNGKEYEYTYDNIGNRITAVEGNSGMVSRMKYTANELNQYTAIEENGAPTFMPQFDVAGNQTLIKTETGIWSVIYNAENRPVSFSNVDSGTVIECAYDSLGRRVYKKVLTNGTISLHQRYIYRGYLQIACIDLTRSHHPALWFITWDPTQRIATRPLAIQKDGTWYTYGLDLTKNVCEIFGTTGYIATSYTYAPFGLPSQSTGGAAAGSTSQPIQWSSEFCDSELALVYYNYRYYNPTDGRWLAVDPIISPNLYSYCNNVTIIGLDVLGLAFLNKHLATADLFISNYSNIDKDKESKECFRFGSLLPDIPFASIARNVTLYLMDESSILRRIFSGFGTVISWIVSPFSYLYDLLFGSDDDSYSSFDQNAENIIFHLSNISRIETLRSHYGDLASYHAMAMKGTETPESTFDNMVENIKKFILEGHGSCNCSRFIANGKIMHMMTDLHTASHAKLVSSNGKKIKVKHFYYYGYQQGEKHAMYDDIEEKDMRAAINTYKKVMYAIDNKPSSIIKKKISSVIDISNATIADREKDYKQFQ